MAGRTTEYVILRQTQEEGPNQRSTYEVLPGSIEAGAAPEARRRAAEREYADTGATDGVYVAVPARSFEPVSLTIETRPRAVSRAVVSR